VTVMVPCMPSCRWPSTGQYIAHVPAVLNVYVA
jgi:hypothetical protein